MSDWMIAAVGAWIIASPFIASIVGKELRRRRLEQTRQIDEDAMNDLGQPIMRFRLQTMIDNYGLTGSVNIRDGKVLPAPSDHVKSEMSRLLMQAYARGNAVQANDNRMLCVWIDGAWIPTEISLSDLRAASIMLEDR